MTGPTIRYRLIKKDEHTGARLDELITPHGTFPTPVFMPIGTPATVKTMSPEESKEMGAGVTLSSTYYSWLCPGEDLVEKAGGLHKFMDWDQPILTDLGGFQIFSLSDIRKVEEEDVHSRSHLNGSKVFLSPEKAINIQNKSESDTMMSFDECPPLGESYEYVKRSIERTSHQAECDLKAHAGPGRQGLFSIIQGTGFEDLRRQSAKGSMGMDFPGYSIGSLPVGESKEEINRVLDFTAPLIPESKPRYLVGMSAPDSLIDEVVRGIDMFDRVLLARIARSDTCMISQGRLAVKGAQYARDFHPFDERCGCYVCRNYTRAYIRYLIKYNKTFGTRLASYRNLYFLLDLMKNIRQATMNDNSLESRQVFLEEYGFNKANTKSF